LFGFIVAAGPACVQPAGVTSGYAILCTPLTLVAPDAAQTHLLADDVHLTTAGQKVLAAYEYGLVVAPSMVSMLAETPLKTRAGLINTIQNQILVSQGQRGQAGFNTWLSGDFASLRTSDYLGFPGQSGDPAALTAGFDYRLPRDFLVGVAISAGRQRVDFPDGFGRFYQSEFSVSLYGAGAIGPLWFDMIATYGAINDDVHRIVPVGVTVQNNAASVSGSNISFAAELGYSFHFSPIVHGPVAGVELQQVRVGNFTETGSFTSLGFGSQTRKSAVSEFGYRVAFQFERFSPFIKAVWNHEFASTDRQVSASLTTSQAPEYSMPAARFGSDWASLTAGTAIKLDRNLTGLVALTSTMAQQSVASFGGQVGINVSF
jgi:outer membrane lipase/esterase